MNVNFIATNAYFTMVKGLKNLKHYADDCCRADIDAYPPFAASSSA